jgi:uncharacterized membrane protein
MSTLDVISVALFFAAWLALEPLMAAGLPRPSKSLSKNIAHIRIFWMREGLMRDDNFTSDAAILGHTINSASFFGSANLIVVVGLSRALFTDPYYGSADGLVATIVSKEPAWFIQLKVLLVMATLLRGLFDFIWAVRQLNYCLASIAACPARHKEPDIAAWTSALTKVLNPALRSFSIGVRSYYFTVAAALWFLGPIPFITGTVVSAGLLIWRQSWSDTSKGIAAIRNLLD